MVFFSRKTFRRRVLQKIVGVSHTRHIPHISITPHISHTYISIQNVSHQYVSVQHVSHQYVSIQCVSIQKVCISRFCSHIHSKRIPPIRIRSTVQHVSTQYVSMRCVSIQCVSIQKVCISRNRKRIPPIRIRSTRIPLVRIHSMRIHSKGLHQQEWQWVWVSLHVISYHCYSAGMVMKIETLLFLKFLCNFIDWIYLYRARMNMKFIASYWPACLPVVCLCACFLIIFYYSIPPGGMGRVNRKATLSLKTCRRSPKTVAKRKFHLLSVNPLAKSVVSIAQNCSETQILFALTQPSR